MSKIKEKTGIPWLSDFRDPWTEIDFYDQLRLTRRADKKHHSLEKKVLENSDRVVVIGHQMKKQFERIAHVNPVVIHNGYDEEDFLETERRTGDVFSIVHAGAMNKNRNHDSFWKAVRKIITEQNLSQLQFKIKLIGSLDYTVKGSIAQYNLSAYTEILSYLPHNEIMNELVSASLLYLPINNTPNAKAIQTGKIFEYIASGRPILGVGPVDGDAATILSKCDAGIMVGFSDEKKIRSVIAENMTSHFSGNDKQTKPCRQFTRKILTQQLADILNRM